MSEPNSPAAPTAQPPEKKKPTFKGSELVPVGTFAHAMEPRNFEELMALANLLAKSDIVPKDFQNKPANIVVAVTLGRELGVGWAQAVQNIAVINGRPSAWGDLVMGLVLNCDFYQDSSDEWDPKLDGGTATFHSKRKGKSLTTRTFSHEDAKKAGLLGKDTYQKYERRMLFNRARAFALRDDYADVLKGLRIREEEEDIITLEQTPGGEYAMPKPRDAAPTPEAAQSAAPAEAAASQPAAQAATSQPAPAKAETQDGAVLEVDFIPTDVQRKGDITLISSKDAEDLRSEVMEHYGICRAAMKAKTRLHAKLEIDRGARYIVELSPSKAQGAA